MLLTFTGTFVAAFPVSCMPVLFKEISDDLNLSLVQLGTIWGMSSLAGLVVSIIGGVISDRFGPKNVLCVCSLLVGITGALRGLSNSFFMLAATMFLNALIRLVIPVTITKTVGQWFKGPKMGTVMGIAAMGMGFGLMLGPLISATVVSPLIGGWRHVMYLYGAVSALFGIFWFLVRARPYAGSITTTTKGNLSLKQSFVKLIRLKSLWMMALTMLFRQGGIIGVTGYLALYLRNKGWTNAAADGTLSIFYVISTILVVPLSVLSDRLGSRKMVLFPALLITVISTALIPLVPDSLIWLMVALTGICMDGFLAILSTMVLETKNVGYENSGLALGIVYTISQFGSLASPPLGNSFASKGAGLPFFFWAGLAAAAFVIFFFVHETGRKKPNVIQIISS
jgi:MFS family permease